MCTATSRMQSSISTALLLATICWTQLARAQMIITYPGWRGNNLITNGTAPDLNPNSIGVDYSQNRSDPGVTFPYGMQYIYPCGGLPQTNNRTLWPVHGGAINFQPGWGEGLQKVWIYINMGVTAAGQSAPPNMSHVMVPPFQINGPSNDPYPGQSVCLPQVPMPVNVSLGVGDNVTIQVIEATQSGAALYSCVDVTLAEPADVEPVTPANCLNSTGQFTFEGVFSTEVFNSGANSPLTSSKGLMAIFTTLAIAAVMTFS